METGTRLTVRAYHISSLEYGEENRVTLDGHMTVCPSVAEKIREKEPLIKDISIRIIRPDEHDQHTNTVMDVIPLSTKVLGKVGEGITHTLTGVYVILTGVDQPGDETKMLAENTVTETDARKALALLKLKMRKWEEKG